MSVFEELQDELGRRSVIVADGRATGTLYAGAYEHAAFELVEKASPDAQAITCALLAISHRLEYLEYMA